MEQQEQLLAERVPGWPIPVFCDELKARALRKRDPATLGARSSMARPTTRRLSGETIHVASLGALAWRQDDFARFLDVLAGRKAVLIAYHEGERAFNLASAEDRQAAITAFPEARQRGSRQKGRIIGAKVSAERRLNASRAGADKVRDRWGKPGEVQYKLVAETGLTINTVVKQLGLWRIAKARWKRRIERAGQ